MIMFGGLISKKHTPLALFFSSLYLCSYLGWIILYVRSTLRIFIPIDKIISAVSLTMYGLTLSCHLIE